MAHDLLNTQLVLLTSQLFSSPNPDVLVITLCNKYYVCNDDDFKWYMIK